MRRGALLVLGLLLAACGRDAQPRPRLLPPNASDDVRFMQLAIDTAREGGIGKGHYYGAVVVRDGEVVARSAAHVQGQTDPTAHAEVLAIRMACTTLGRVDLSDCTLYSTVEPCPMCFRASVGARIGRVVFGASLEDVKKHSRYQMDVPCAYLNARWPEPTVLEGGVHRDACLALLESD